MICELFDSRLRIKCSEPLFLWLPNIAEGAERGGKDFMPFLTISRGSASKPRTQVDMGFKVGAISSENIFQLSAQKTENLKSKTSDAIGSSHWLRHRNDEASLPDGMEAGGASAVGYQ